MKKTLYSKFLLGYLIFVSFGFLVVATFVSNMTLEHLKREKADALYRESTLIANTYASDLYNNEISLDVVKEQLDALSTYLSGLCQALLKGKLEGVGHNADAELCHSFLPLYDMCIF